MKAGQSEASLPGLRIGEVVLRTGRYDEMKQWYSQVLAMDPYLEHIPVGMPEPHTNVATQLWATQLRLCFFRLALDHLINRWSRSLTFPGRNPWHRQVRACTTFNFAISRPGSWRAGT